MKLKLDRVNLQNLIRLTDRYLNFDSVYSNIDINILPEFSDKIIELCETIPIVIFTKDSRYLNNESSSIVEVFKDIFIQASLEIEYILNIEHLIILINLYKKNQEFQDLQVSILFINLGTQDINYNQLSKLDILAKLKLFTKKNHATLDTKLLKNLFDNDTFLLKYKIQNTLVDYLFPSKRKKSIEKVDPIFNPWHYLYLQCNSKYLTLADAKKNAKKIMKIHCPICAAEKDVDDDIITINNSELIFLCNHKNTQFVRYENYKIDIQKFNEDFNGVDSYALCRFFKHNIQPVNRNNVYFVKQFLEKNKVEYTPLKKYMRVPQVKAIKYEGQSILKEYYCPICAKKHYINFDENVVENYIDINNIEYTHYLKLFQLEKSKIFFMCNHEATVYEQYKYFSIRNISKDSLIDNALKLISHYIGNYMDGKKIIYGVIGEESYIIDLANYL